MNQIPREGEFCGGCPCRTPAGEYERTYCAFYDLQQELDYGVAKRLPICLKERPQIITTGKEE